ncbi:hypothetical protein RDABS01_018282 [Bienertia sinuspersici]
MAFTKNLLCLLVILVGFSCIIGSNAIAITRTKSLMHENLARFQASMNSPMFDQDVVEAMQAIRKRKMMEVNLQDYPGSGANNRHTPRP